MLARAFPIWQWSLAPHCFCLKFLKSFLAKLPILQVVTVYTASTSIVETLLTFASLIAGFVPNPYKVAPEE